MIIRNCIVNKLIVIIIIVILYSICTFQIQFYKGSSSGDDVLSKDYEGLSKEEDTKEEHYN